MKTPITFLQGILIAIIASIILLIMFIIFSNHNTYGLVEKYYYQKELNHQSQIDKETRAHQLVQNINIYNDKKEVVVQFPSIFSTDDINGEIIFYRPSNPDEDFNVRITLDEDGLQIIGTTELQKGAWIVKVFWNNKQDEYYSEKRIFINR